MRFLPYLTWVRFTVAAGTQQAMRELCLKVRSILRFLIGLSKYKVCGGLEREVGFESHAWHPNGIDA